MRAHDHGHELRRRRDTEDRYIKPGLICLRIEWALHERIRHHAHNRAPRLRLGRIEEPNSFSQRTLVPIIFPGETGVHHRHRLSGIVIVDGEIAALQDFQADGGKITVGDKFKIALRPVAIGHVAFTVHFILTESAEGHAKTAGHRRAVEGGIAAQRAQRADEELLASFCGRIIALHQTHSRGVNAVLVVAIVERCLITDRFDLKRTGDQKRGRQRNLCDDQNARNDIDQSAAISAPAFFHHLRGIGAGAQQSGNEAGHKRRHQSDNDREH